MRTILRFWFLLVVIPLAESVTKAQNQGDFQFKSFTALDLKSSDWIQSITQDNRGIIFAGNNIGTILEYDGTTWRSIPATNGPIRSLKTDKNGRIYVGSFGEFGFLEPDDNGAMQYHSLMDKVDEADKNISDVWSIEILDEVVFFRSVERLFRLEADSVTAYSNPFGWFGNLIISGKEVFVTIDYTGILFKIKGDSLIQCLDSPDLKKIAFGSSARYSSGTGKRIIGSWGGGVYIFDPDQVGVNSNKVFSRINTIQAVSNNYLQKAVEVYTVSEGIYAARTDNGVTIFNRDGAGLYYLNTSNGLNSSLVETVFSDHNNVLWIGTEKGITRVDISSPFSSWYSFSEYTGTTWGIVSYSNSIYFWGINGIFQLRNNKAEKIHEQTYGLTEFREPSNPQKSHLLAINFNSLVELHNNNLKILLKFPEPLLYQQIFISKRHPDRIYLYCANGLYLIRFINGKWLWEGNIADISTGIQSFAEDAYGVLWLTVNNNRSLICLIPHIRAVAGQKPQFAVRHFNPPDNVAGKWIRCFTVKNMVFFGTDKGLFRFEPDRQEFLPDSTFGNQFTSGSHAVYILREGSDGSVFIADRLHKYDDIGLCIPGKKGIFRWYSRPFLGLTPYIRIYDACFDADNNIWLVSDDGLHRYDPLKDRKAPGSYHTFIREVITGKDSILFYGTYYTLSGNGTKIPVTDQPDFMIPQLKHRQNSIRFRYSASSFESEDQNAYQYMLDGFDEQWSPWQTSGLKEYSNLSPGQYTFRVIGRNVFGIISNEATYRFSILPPWYKTYWAYIIYLVAGGLSIYGIILLNLRRLRAMNTMLEETVRERTAEVVKQKEEISTINENLLVKQEELEVTLDTLYEIQEQLIRSEKMASLGQLIAGIAHEINTPLGTIKASVNDISNNSYQVISSLPRLLKEMNDMQFQQFVELVNRSSCFQFPVTSRQERQYKKALKVQLEEKNCLDASIKADTLVDMGIYTDIDPYLEILENGNSDFLMAAYHLSQLIRNSKNIEVSIDRASKLVSALKNYSHMHNNDEKIEADISEGIITVLILFKNQLKQGIQLTTEFEPIPKVFCYPDELNQVWTNLISNSIDAMNGKGRLHISLGTNGEFAEIRVADSGAGIPESVQPRIFDAFYSTKSPGAGSGLGLFIVKEIVDKHAGKISFETGNHGTVFTVLLPMITRKNKTGKNE